jgi:hypothetical protein
MGAGRIYVVAHGFVDAYTGSGVTLLGTYAGQIKRLIAGTSMALDTTTTPGGIILNASGGSTATFAKVRRNAALTYASATPIVWDTVVLDADGLHSATWNGLTIAVAGVYLCVAHVGVHWTAAGEILVGLTINGISGGPGGSVGQQLIASGPGDGGDWYAQTTITALLNLAVNDVVGVVGYMAAYAGMGTATNPANWIVISGSGVGSTGWGYCPTLSVLKVA